MEKEVISIINRHTSNYFIKSLDNTSMILLYKPYKPFYPLGNDYAVISGNYVAYVELNAVKNRLIDALSAFEPTPFKGNLKGLFVEAKAGLYLKNNLIAIPPFGTRVSLQAFSISIPLKEKLPSPASFPNYCQYCQLCHKACPTLALNSEGFTPNLCLRQAMNDYASCEVDFSLLNGGLLGCDACQDICPYNAKVGFEDMPESLKKMVKIDTLLALCNKGKEALLPLADYIGANYIKPLRLQFFALNGIRDKKNAHLALQYLNSSHEILVSAAKKVLIRHNIPF